MKVFLGRYLVDTDHIEKANKSMDKLSVFIRFVSGEKEEVPCNISEEDIEKGEHSDQLVTELSPDEFIERIVEFDRLKHHASISAKAQTMVKESRAEVLESIREKGC